MERGGTSLCRSRLLLVAVGYLILITHTCTGETAFTFCNNVQPQSDTTFDLSFDGGTDGKSQCTCSIFLTTPTAMLSFEVFLAATSGRSLGAAKKGDNENKTVTCEPFMAFHWGEHGQVGQCAGKASSSEESKFLVNAMENATVTLHNHHRRPIEARVRVTMDSGSVFVQCYPVESSTRWLGDTCPCDSTMLSPIGGNGGFPKRSDVSTGQTGLTVGLVAVAIFLIILAVIGGLWWWRKRKADDGEKDLERVTGTHASENPGFAPSTTASRSSGIDRAVVSDPHYANVPGDHSTHIPFDADPELDLSLRTPAKGKGSEDSGNYSMPTEKAPNNNYPPYAPTPLGPDQMYNPMLAKQPSMASLTGQGALHGSVDHLQPANPMYAEPIKKANHNPPPPQRSASQDALNTNTSPHGDLVQARSRSHNASKSSVASGGSVVETDV